MSVSIRNTSRCASLCNGTSNVFSSLATPRARGQVLRNVVSDESSAHLMHVPAHAFIQIIQISVSIVFINILMPTPA